MTETHTTARGRRVAVTGLGVLSPAGGSLEAFWETSISGRSALRRIRSLDVSAYTVTVGGEVDDSLFTDAERPGAKQTVDRAVLLGKTAAARALRDAGLKADGSEPQDVGLCLGCGAGPAQSAEAAYEGFFSQGPRGVRPRTVPRMMFNAVGAEISIGFRLVGPHSTLAAACASANMAMSRAFDLVRYGRQDRVLTGGVDMPLCATVFTGWAAMRILDPSPDPQHCCLPFHRERRGFSLGEGAAMFLFEDMEQARARGAKVYGEVCGYGENSDAVHLTRSDPERQAEAIRMALDDARIGPADVDYINAHGTATHVNDVHETQAIKIALGDEARRVPISSTKSVIGHTMGASGALELVAVLGALRAQTAPPTANLDDPDPECDLDYVPLEARPVKINVVLSNSFAFGGANSVMVFRRDEESA